MPLPIPPTDPDVSPYRRITINEYWLSLLYGLFELALDRSLYDIMTDTEWYQTEQRVLTAMTLFEDDNTVIEDVRLTADGLLEKKIDGVWLPVGQHEIDPSEYVPSPVWDGTSLSWDTDGDGIADTSPVDLQGVEGEAGVDGVDGTSPEPCNCDQYNNVPDVEDDDKFCFAASQLADQFADDLQDKSEAIQLIVDGGGNLLQSAVTFFIGYIPILGTTGEAIFDFLFEGLTQPAIEFFVDNCYDPDARSLARKELFCAFKKAHPNLENWNDHIDYPLGMPSLTQLYNPVEGWKYVIDNFTDMVEFVYGIGSGESAGWGILAYMHVIDQAYRNNPLGLENPVTKAMISAMNSAQNFDDRDCSDANCGGGCTTLDFENYTYSAVNLVTGSYDVEGLIGVCNDVGSGNWAMQVNIIIPDAGKPLNLESCRIYYSNIGTTADGASWYADRSPWHNLAFDNNVPAGGRTYIDLPVTDPVLIGDSLLALRSMFAGTCPSHITLKIHKVVLCWVGESGDPFTGIIEGVAK